MKTESIPAIENGTVIDHLHPKRLPAVMEMLDLSGDRVSIGLNMGSARMGRKALIKVHDRVLTADETDQIALLSPGATISIVRNFELISKQAVKLPALVQQFTPCPNSRCITKFETTDALYEVRERRGKVQLRCTYCESVHDH